MQAMLCNLARSGLGTLLRASLGVSGGIHALILIPAFAWVPALGPDDTQPEAGADRTLLMSMRLGTDAESELGPVVRTWPPVQWEALPDEEQPPQLVIPERPAAKRGEDQVEVLAVVARRSLADDRSGGTGTRATGKEGDIGNPHAPELALAWGVLGPQDNPEPTTTEPSPPRYFWSHLLLTPERGGHPDEPAPPWSKRDGMGRDGMGAQGNMFGPEIGDPRGTGYGALGRGQGGGGNSHDIGLGRTGRLGHGTGVGIGQGAGTADNTDASAFRRPGGALVHVPVGPSLRTRVPEPVAGRLVQLAIAKNKACYQRVLVRLAPNGANTVMVRFTAGTDGAVAAVSATASQGLDGSIANCVVQAVSALRLSSPGNEPTVMAYRIRFEGGGAIVE